MELHKSQLFATKIFSKDKVKPKDIKSRWCENVLHVMHCISWHSLELSSQTSARQGHGCTWLKGGGALPVATAARVLLIRVVQSLSLQAAVKQLLHRISVCPAGNHLSIHKGREHGGLQEARQEVQVCSRLNWEEGALAQRQDRKFRDIVFPYYEVVAKIYSKANKFILQK